ncbi:thiamine/thiamine pyrophosphate ABC transporter permease [Vibrio sp. SS-MA-C1-2]|uniref:thiamine/thiamine pyrophosphate ABC transporter permease n=1 Tax=Vibrio sp. SS-MA-C1-2 TaxID=2908646 RepID=UPI001F27EDC8|nr:thiamine/thiamine pyrophosphate ABC transporter permease [Vibrio sp. SS-MA-C1-2]UJF19143.1 thiamine/thiamine pyrophosphate ABC transporter permease [Vibrio sp. SS-MA-C1-2]
MVSNSKIWPGITITGLILLLIGAAITLLFSHSSLNDISQIWQDPYIRHITQFSFYQAGLSVLLSVLLSIPIALALYRRQFFAKKLLLRVFAMTLVLPVLVAVFGLLAIYGNSGLINKLFDSKFNIYGLGGILLAHVFFNAPLSARLLIQSLNAIPSQQHKLASQLGLNSWSKFKFVEWPVMRQQLPHIIGLIFMLCFTSFATVMSLGGGPKSTTVELAIYQAIRYDFDLGYGALLAIWQMLLCGTVVLISLRFAKSIAIDSQQALEKPTFIDSPTLKIWDKFWIIIASILVFPPLIAIVYSGLNSQLWLQLQQPALWSAVYHSLTIAFGAALFALVSGVTILLTSRHWRLQKKNLLADGIELAATLILVTPGLVISTGLFLLIRSFSDIFSSDPFSYAFTIVVLVNGLMALPYIVKSLNQSMLHIAQQYNPLCESLGLFGLTRLYLIEWRALKAPIANAFALSFVLSLGDLSAISLFGSQDFTTLPLYLYQLMGSYQMEGAAVVALLLLLVSLAIFSLIENQLTQPQKP